jgi:Holliday junction resolvase-like predicted endonuclease
MSAPATEKPAKRQTLKSARLARAHWLYSIEDVIALYLVSTQIVRNWMRYGLKAIRAQKTLFLGQDLNEFHARRRKEAKVPCTFEEIYCVCCKQKHSFLIEPFTVEQRGKFRTLVPVQVPMASGGRPDAGQAAEARRPD